MIRGINKEKVFIKDIYKTKLLDRENLAEDLINLHIITLNEIAGLCNLSLNKVKELNKSVKDPEFY